MAGPFSGCQIEKTFHTDASRQSSFLPQWERKGFFYLLSAWYLNLLVTPLLWENLYVRRSNNLCAMKWVRKSSNITRWRFRVWWLTHTMRTGICIYLSINLPWRRYGIITVSVFWIVQKLWNGCLSILLFRPTHKDHFPTVSVMQNMLLTVHEFLSYHLNSILMPEKWRSFV